MPAIDAAGTGEDCAWSGRVRTAAMQVRELIGWMCALPEEGKEWPPSAWSLQGANGNEGLNGTCVIV